jgi:GT2 family glycosyltransferase
MSEEIKATVIIPNYNGMKYLPACMEALKHQTVNCFRTLVIENASTDGSEEWLSENAVPYIREEKNLGFAGGVNAGIRETETPYVILLNNDTEVFPDFVEQLLKAIEKSERIFSVSSLMLKAGKKDLTDDAGDGMNLFGWAYQIGIDEPAAGFRRSRNVFSACGGAAIYRRSVFREIGLFDEAHFAYLEDTDIGWRAKLCGYVNRYCPKAKVYHYGSATSGSRYNDFKVHLAARNNIYLHYKNQSGLQLLFNLPWLSAGIVIKFVFFTSRGFLIPYLSGVAEGFTTLSRVKRRDFSVILPSRVLSAEWEMIAGTFEYVFRYILRHH